SDTTANNLQVFDDNGNYLYNITPTPQPNPSQLHGGIAIDSFGEVYFCDSANGNVEGFILGPSSATYDYTWSGQGHLVNPNDVKIDPQGNLVVADNFNGLVFNFAWTDDTLLNNTTQGGFNLAGVALDASGNIYATNQSGTTAQVVEYDYAYNYLGAFSGSGWPTPLSLPIGIAVDSQSNLWIVDTYNSRVVQATTQGQYLGAVSTGLLPPSRPQYLTFDAIGSLFVTDPADFVIDQFLYN
ncbi:MAG TPA: NHL repeat-containing protein, partial [bacterium]|nr:NHL repeat-containing protein [bacterium]